MFCDACGSAMSPQQSFCTACGKQVGVAPAWPAGAAGAAIVSDGRVAKHLEIVAWLWIAAGVLTVPLAVALIAIGAFPYEHFFSGAAMPAGVPALFAILHTVFLVLGVFLFVVSGIHFVTAWGLFHHAPWARILTIAFAFLRILEVPLGTALAIYTIWVLMGPSSEAEYRALAPK
jgi:hypothetical protein